MYCSYFQEIVVCLRFVKPGGAGRGMIRSGAVLPAPSFPGSGVE